MAMGASGGVGWEVCGGDHGPKVPSFQARSWDPSLMLPAHRASAVQRKSQYTYTLPGDQAMRLVGLE
jgi:hypothetical protein